MSFEIRSELETRFYMRMYKIDKRKAVLVVRRYPAGIIGEKYRYDFR
jgi:hypothetical protein